MCVSRFLDQKNFAVFPVSRHFSYSREFVVSLFPDTLTFQKCLETGKTTKSFQKIIMFKGFCHFSCLKTLPGFKSVWKQEKRPNPLRKSLFSRDFVISPVYRHFLDSKVSRNRKTTKPFEKIIIFKGFSCFWTFLITKKMSKT